MEEKSWQAMRDSGFRTLFAASFALAIAFVLYSRFTVPSSGFIVNGQHLTSLAYAMLAITAASMVSALYGAYTLLRSERLRTAGENTLAAHIAKAFENRDFWRIAIVAGVAYGIFFSLLSQILVYRPDISLTERGITVPSTEIIPCCSLPGYVPMFTAYLTDHFLILVIPVNVMLAVVVSALVGFNISLSIFAYRLRQSVGKKNTVVSGLGAAAGLFVGCPTCAGSLFSALLGIGIAGAGTSAAALAPFQTLFIAASVPALIVAPFVMARGIRSVSSCQLS